MVKLAPIPLENFSFALGDAAAKPLTSVAHVTHVESALRIIADGGIEPRLISDESRLKPTRIRVIWLSPNDWSGRGGFRYGNVRFHLDWASVVKDRRCYFVETVAYSPAAARLLVTKLDRATVANVGELAPYDATKLGGPWHTAAGTAHYWNSKKTLEVMLEGSLPLESIVGVDFVDHQNNQCAIDWKNCPYNGATAGKAGADFIAHAAARNINVASLPWAGAPTGRDSLAVAGRTLLRRVLKQATAFTGSIRAGTPTARALSQAILSASAHEQWSHVKALGELFASGDEADRALVEATAGITGLTDAELR